MNDDIANLYRDLLIFHDLIETKEDVDNNYYTWTTSFLEYRSSNAMLGPK